jgi:hypothetical protein
MSPEDGAGVTLFEALWSEALELELAAEAIRMPELLLPFRVLAT